MVKKKKKDSPKKKLAVTKGSLQAAFLKAQRAKNEKEGAEVIQKNLEDHEAPVKIREPARLPGGPRSRLLAEIGDPLGAELRRRTLQAATSLMKRRKSSRAVEPELEAELSDREYDLYGEDEEEGGGRGEEEDEDEGRKGRGRESRDAERRSRGQRGRDDVRAARRDPTRSPDPERERGRGRGAARYGRGARPAPEREPSRRELEGGPRGRQEGPSRKRRASVSPARPRDPPKRRQVQENGPAAAAAAAAAQGPRPRRRSPQSRSPPAPAAHQINRGAKGPDRRQAQPQPEARRPGVARRRGDADGRGYRKPSPEPQLPSSPREGSDFQLSDGMPRGAAELFGSDGGASASEDRELERRPSPDIDGRGARPQGGPRRPVNGCRDEGSDPEQEPDPSLPSRRDRDRRLEGKGKARDGGAGVERRPRREDRDRGQGEEGRGDGARRAPREREVSERKDNPRVGRGGDGPLRAQRDAADGEGGDDHKGGPGPDPGTALASRLPPAAAKAVEAARLLAAGGPAGQRGREGGDGGPRGMQEGAGGPRRAAGQALALVENTLTSRLRWRVGREMREPPTGDVLGTGAAPVQRPAAFGLQLGQNEYDFGAPIQRGGIGRALGAHAAGPGVGRPGPGPESFDSPVPLPGSAPGHQFLPNTLGDGTRAAEDDIGGLFGGPPGRSTAAGPGVEDLFDRRRGLGGLGIGAAAGAARLPLFSGLNGSDDPLLCDLPASRPLRLSPRPGLEDARLAEDASDALFRSRPGAANPRGMTLSQPGPISSRDLLAMAPALPLQATGHAEDLERLFGGRHRHGAASSRPLAAAGVARLRFALDAAPPVGGGDDLGSGFDGAGGLGSGLGPPEPRLDQDRSLDALFGAERAGPGGGASRLQRSRQDASIGILTANDGFEAPEDGRTLFRR